MPRLGATVPVPAAPARARRPVRRHL